MALPPLLVKIGADTTGLDRGLDRGSANLLKFAKVGAAAGAAVGAAMLALTKASLSNIDALAKQARSLGLTTDAFQKMTLVAEEAGVSAGSLNSMLGLMQRNITELSRGTKLQTDAFTSLGLSIRDLQGLDPDEQFALIAEQLNDIQDPAEKTALAMEVFGRSGRAAVNMLEDYNAKVADAALFQERFGISVRQDASDSVERANDAVGRLGMVFSGLGNQLATAVAPAMEKTANGLIRLAEAMVGAETRSEQLQTKLENLAGVLRDDVLVALQENADLLDKFAPVLDELAGSFDNVADQIFDLIPAVNQYAQALANAGEREKAAEIQALVTEIERLTDDFDASTDSFEDFNAEISVAQERLAQLVSGMETVDGVDFSSVMGRITSLGDALRAAAGEAIRLSNSLPGLPVTTGEGLSPDAPDLLPPNPNAPRTSLRPQLPSVDASFGTPEAKKGGGGGGLKDEFARRLEALTEGLQTERETLEIWREEGLALLAEALEREMLTEEEFRLQREKLEAEHQDRLLNIRDRAAKSSLEIAAGAGEDILSAMSNTNKRALKVAKVFGAAQALISTYQGAAEALKLPFPENLAAAAAVLAKGLGFVAAIKGVSDSGGGGGASGGGGGLGASQALPEQRLIIDATNANNTDFRTTEALIDAMNEAGRRGVRLSPILLGAT